MIKKRTGRPRKINREFVELAWRQESPTWSWDGTIKQPPSYAKFAREMGISRRQLKRILKEMGLIRERLMASDDCLER